MEYLKTSQMLSLAILLALPAIQISKRYKVINQKIEAALWALNSILAYKPKTAI